MVSYVGEPGDTAERNIKEPRTRTYTFFMTADMKMSLVLKRVCYKST